MRNRVLHGLGTFMLAGILTGCGSGSGGGQEGATEDQMKDPAWVRARLKELDKEATIPKTKPTADKK